MPELTNIHIFSIQTIVLFVTFPMFNIHRSGSAVYYVNKYSEARFFLLFARTTKHGTWKRFSYKSTENTDDAYTETRSLERCRL